jgi:hypothetical protein
MNTSKACNMPRTALRTGCVDFSLSPRTIAHALVTLVMVKGAAHEHHGISREATSVDYTCVSYSCRPQREIER